jgi:hypothetical protein
LDSSPPVRLFDSTFVLFAANYLLDGVLTAFGLLHGFAREGNPIASDFAAHGIVSAKFLGLVSIMGAAWLAAKSHPPVVPKLRGLFRVALLVFAAVCVSNLAVLWGVVS